MLLHCHSTGLICLASLLWDRARQFPLQKKEKHSLLKNTSVMEIQIFFFLKAQVHCKTAKPASKYWEILSKVHV